MSISNNTLGSLLFELETADLLSKAAHREAHEADERLRLITAKVKDEMGKLAAGTVVLTASAAYELTQHTGTLLTKPTVSAWDVTIASEPVPEAAAAAVDDDDILNMPALPIKPFMPLTTDPDLDDTELDLALRLTAPDPSMSRAPSNSRVS
jgi:hypothetical protein